MFTYKHHQHLETQRPDYANPYHQNKKRPQLRQINYQRGHGDQKNPTVAAVSEEEEKSADYNGNSLGFARSEGRQQLHDQRPVGYIR